MNTKAFLFDLNGTMINDMEYHINAWYKILNDLGAGISLAQMKQECYGKNNELLDRIFPGRFSEEEKNKMSYEKEKVYQQAFRPQLKLINGLEIFLEKAKDAGIKMAIGSAAILFNIDFVIDGTDIRKYFDVLISAEDVTFSKPDPETFLKAAEQLNVSVNECLVFEDTPKGVESAKNAGMKAIVITTLHQPEEFKAYPNVIRFANDFTELADILLPKNLLQQV
jgi:haloacid dehalogenase superfamily, subfamily IA, variant 3 with third motif having DD or ED